MDINAVRDTVVGIASNSTDMTMVTALALIYIGDSIREGTSDIGPALARGLDQVAVNIGGIESGLNSISSEMAAA